MLKVFSNAVKPVISKIVKVSGEVSEQGFLDFFFSPYFQETISNIIPTGNVHDLPITLQGRISWKPNTLGSEELY